MKKSHVNYVRAKIEEALTTHADEFDRIESDNAQMPVLLRGLAQKVEKFQAFFNDLLPSEAERAWARKQLIRFAEQYEAAKNDPDTTAKRQEYRKKHTMPLSILDGIIAAHALGYQLTKNRESKPGSNEKEWAGSLVKAAMAEIGIHKEADTYRREYLDRYAKGIPAKDRYFSEQLAIYREELEFIGDLDDLESAMKLAERRLNTAPQRPLGEKLN